MIPSSAISIRSHLDCRGTFAETCLPIALSQLWPMLTASASFVACCAALHMEVCLPASST